MKIEMLMPQMGESITEATVSTWCKAVGEYVEKDEIILEISTDKVDSEIPAPESGVLVEVLAAEGDVVPVKKVIAVIDTEAKASEAPEKPEEKTEEKPEAPEESPSTVEKSSTTASPASTADSGTANNFSPLVKKLAEQNGILLSELSSNINGTGAGGRITKVDFENYLKNKGSNKSSSAPASIPSKPSPSGTKPAGSRPPSSNASPSGDWNSDGTKIVPMNRMRQAIAEHMVRSKRTSPHVYSVQEVDVTDIAVYRKKEKPGFIKAEGFNLTYTPFFLDAAVRALVKFPMVNSSVREKSVLMNRSVNIGCAVALGTSGLIVPVIKRAEELTFVGIARGLNDISTRARNKKLTPDDVSGGTFTVTNTGSNGTLIGTPIINQPQVAILSLGAIVKRPVVINNMIAIRDMCYLTLSYDHRIIDGALGGQFLAFIKNYLENWDTSKSVI